MTLIAELEMWAHAHSRNYDLQIAKIIDGIHRDAYFLHDNEHAWNNGLGISIKHYTSSIDAVLGRLKNDYWEVVSVTNFGRAKVELQHTSGAVVSGGGSTIQIAFCVAMLRAFVEKKDE